MSPFDPFNSFDFLEQPLESLRIFGIDLRAGDRVRLWPQKRADILDSALAGQVAIIEAIEQDLENQIHLAVVLEDDPGRELGMLRQPGHRFFFSPEEVEPLSLHQPQTEPKTETKPGPETKPKTESKTESGARDG